MSEIYLIRHDQASLSDADCDRLSTVGIRRSQVLADYLFAQDARFDAIYSGPLKHPKNTARAFCERFGARPPSRQAPNIPGAFSGYDAPPAGAGPGLADRPVAKREAASSTSIMGSFRQHPEDGITALF